MCNFYLMEIKKLEDEHMTSQTTSDMTSQSATMTPQHSDKVSRLTAEQSKCKTNVKTEPIIKKSFSKCTHNNSVTNDFSVINSEASAQDTYNS